MPPRNMGAGTSGSYPYAHTVQGHQSPEDRVVHVGEDYFSYYGGSSTNATPSNGRTPFSQAPAGDYYDYHDNACTPSREAGPSNGTQGRANLVRSPPTKNLIAEYERMSSPPPGSSGVQRNKSTRKRQYVYDYRTEPSHSSYLKTPERGHTERKRLPNEVPIGLKKDKDKDRSPLRQSIRNLFSVLKKGVGKKKSVDDALGVPYTLGVKDVQSQMGRGQEDMHPQPYAGARQKSGTLLYLSQTSSLDDIPGTSPSSRPNRRPTPTWKSCTASLRFSPSPSSSPKLVLSSFTPGPTMQLSTYEISLSGCVDIRSLSSSQLREDEKRALHEASAKVEGGVGRMMVFEIKFAGGKEKREGGKMERFAAKGVKERAGWISAIWDAILPHQEAQNTHRPPGQQLGDVPIPTSSIPPSTPRVTNTSNPNIQSPIPRPIPKMSPLLNPSYSQRSLPPFPPDDPPPVSHTSDEGPRGTDLSNNLKESTGVSRKPNLYLDIPPPPTTLQTGVSQSVYSPTSARSSSSGGTPLETPTPTRASTGSASSSDAGPVPPPLAVNTQASLSSSSTTRPSISASTYPSPSTSTSCAPSMLSPGASSRLGLNHNPTSPPVSPSIINLGQLSMVRQRLAQIERNHSEISAKSPGRYSRPGTPITPTGRSTRYTRSEAGSALSTPTPTLKPRTMHPDSSKSATARAKETRETRLPVTRTRSTRRSSDKRVIEDSSKDPKMETPVEDPNPHPVPQPDRSRPSSNSNSKRGLGDLSKKVDGIKNVLGGESGYPTIHQVVLGIENKLQKDSKSLKSVKEKIDYLGGQVSTVLSQAAQSRESESTAEEKENTKEARERQKEVQKAIEDVKTILNTEFPSLKTRLENIQSGQSQLLSREEEKKVVELRNVGASRAGGDEGKPLDLQPILDKLEELRDLAEAQAQAHPSQECANGTSEALDHRILEQLEKLQTRLQEDSNKQVLISQQQADSVRYLNELNNWLETFVNNGTAQIQGLSINVQQLCRSLGCVPSSSQADLSEDPTPTAPGQGSVGLNLLSDIRHLVQGMQARDQNFAQLQVAVHSLLEVLSASQQQMGAESQAIAGLITRQRQDQEALLRSFTDEISGEIRGERLRFVEAMKEATAINVQLHVENFKQELGREVMAMTEEVGRLHREKQQVENQISDLFAFYSKHKQEDALRPILVDNAESAMSGPRHGHGQQIQDSGPRTNLPRSSHHRPLPYPRR